jgi:hypothetical protein
MPLSGRACPMGQQADPQADPGDYDCAPIQDDRKAVSSSCRVPTY